MSERERVDTTEREIVPDVEALAEEPSKTSEASRETEHTPRRSKVRVLQYSRSDLLI